MNSTHQLFSRFEKAGPSWLPIILMSLLGLGLTIFTVEAASKLAVGRAVQQERELYLSARESGLFETHLFQVSDARPETLSDQEQARVTVAGAMIPEMRFLGVLRADPAFKEVDETSAKSAASESNGLKSLFYFWADQTGTSVLMGQIDWTSIPSIQALAGNIKPEEVALSGGLMFSHAKAKDASYLVTIARPRDYALDANERRVAVDLSAPDGINELLSAHSVRTQGLDLRVVASESLSEFAQGFLNQRAFAFVNRGGLSTEELAAVSIEFDDVVTEEDRQIFSKVYELGWRNGVSKQFDRIVMEKASRDIDLDNAPDKNDTEQNPKLLILHPLSCPIRAQSILDGIDPLSQVSTNEGGVSIRIPQVDYPRDLEQRMNSFAESAVGFAEILGSLEDEIRSRDDCKELYQMTDPFPAKVFEIRFSK